MMHLEVICWYSCRVFLILILEVHSIYMYYTMYTISILVILLNKIFTCTNMYDEILRILYCHTKNNDDKLDICLNVHVHV